MAPLPELKYNPKKGEAVVGDLVASLMKDIVEPHKNRRDPLVEAWSETVPRRLRPYCMVKALTGSQLLVRVDSSADMYDLQLCMQDLLQALKKRCQQAGLRTIKLTLR